MVDREYQAPTPALCLLTGLNILIFPPHPEPQWIKIRSDVLPEMRFRCLTVDSALPPGVFWITSQKKLERRQVSSRQVCRRARRQISLPGLIIVWKLFESTAQWCARRERRGNSCVCFSRRGAGLTHEVIWLYVWKVIHINTAFTALRVFRVAQLAGKTDDDVRLQARSRGSFSTLIKHSQPVVSRHSLYIINSVPIPPQTALVWLS